jgi:putative MATE family efflux protein
MQLGFLHQSTAKRREMILNGPILSSVLLLSLPTMLMGTVQSIIPLIDGLFINNLVGVDAASAVTYCGPIVMIMSSLAQGLGVAGMAMIGQMNGRGEYKQAKYISTQIVAAAFSIGLFMVPFMALLSVPISQHVNHQISGNVFLYLSLSALVLPFQFLEVVYNAIKNASGKPEAPFIRMLLMLALKLCFNTLFVGVLNKGIVGSVMATLLANLIISVWMYHEMFIQKGEDRLTLHGFKFDRETMRELFRIGLPSMLASAMMNLGFILINNEVEKYGPIALNGQGIANNITSICFIVPSSFGSSVTTMVSMNIGAGNGNKARKSCHVGTITGAISAALLIAIVVPLSTHLTILFTRNPQVLDMANKSLHIYIYSVVGFAVCMAQVGAFIGMGRTVMPLFINVLRIWLLRYLFILATEKYLGVFSVFWGNLFSNYTCAVITTLLILRVSWVSVIPQKSSADDQKPTTQP